MFTIQYMYMDKLTGETDWRKEKTDIYIRPSTPNLSLCGGNRQLLSPLLQRKNYCVEKDFSLMEKRRGEDRYLLLEHVPHEHFAKYDLLTLKSI